MTNTDGSQFTDPAGYRIGYGRSPDTLDQIIDLKNSGLTSYMVENLPAGTSYFVIMSVNNRGVAGPPSPVIAKTIN